jgi:hypothetical protein
MRYLLIIFGLLVGSSAYSQITISNDSILLNTDFLGRYSLSKTGNREITVKVLMAIPFSEVQRDVFQNEFPKIMIAKNYDGFSYTFQYFADLSSMSPSQLAGIDLEKAGKAYNDAATISLLGLAIGTGIVLNGEPILGGIISLGGGLIGFVLHISANNKLMRAGRTFQNQK